MHLTNDDYWRNWLLARCPKSTDRETTYFLYVKVVADIPNWSVLVPEACGSGRDWPSMKQARKGTSSFASKRHAKRFTHGLQSYFGEIYPPCQFSALCMIKRGGCKFSRHL